MRIEVLVCKLSLSTLTDNHNLAYVTYQGNGNRLLSSDHFCFKYRGSPYVATGQQLLLTGMPPVQDNGKKALVPC